MKTFTDSWMKSYPFDHEEMQVIQREYEAVVLSERLAAIPPADPRWSWDIITPGEMSFQAIAPDFYEMTGRELLDYMSISEGCTQHVLDVLGLGKLPIYGTAAQAAAVARQKAQKLLEEQGAPHSMERVLEDAVRINGEVATLLADEQETQVK